MRLIYRLIAKGIIPDFVLNIAIKHLLRKRLRRERKGGIESQKQRLLSLISILKTSPLAVDTVKANEQHYEVNADFYRLVLGDHLKYSACLWEDSSEPSSLMGLSKAEYQMLSLYCKRAEIKDGMDILELGCGWGSLSLFLAKTFPNSKITGVSNSNSQREFILKLAKERGIGNIHIITSDMNQFAPDRKFDRIVSIEMFEHMRNYQELLRRVSEWLKDDGKLFVHIFCNKDIAYLFEEEGRENWMGRYFFSGGIMPSDDLLLYFQNHLSIEAHWRVNGIHYSKTADAWHDNLMKKKDQALPVLATIYSDRNKYLWFSRWKLFFLACRELFAYSAGEEWFVSHYLFKKQLK